MIFTITRALKKAAPLSTAIILFGSLSFSQIAHSQTSAVEEAQPDTTGVWYHIRHQQVKLANEEFKRLTTQYVNWAPSADLLDAMQRLNKPQTEVVKAKVPKASPEQSASDRKAEFAGKIAALSPDAWAKLSNQDLNRFTAYAEQQGTPELKLLSGWMLIAREQFDTAIRFFSEVADSVENSAQRSQAQDGITAALSQWIQAAVSANDFDLLNQIIHTYPRDIVTQNIDAAGWAAFNSGQFTQAQSLFELSDNLYGLTLALDESGQDSAAFTLACQHTDTAELLAYCLNHYAEQQLALYNDGEYAQSVETAAEMAKIAPLNKDAAVLKGWAEYRLEQFEEAVNSFSNLLAQQPSNEPLQDALYTALSKSDNTNLFSATLARFPALTSRVNAAVANNALARKQFDLAYLLQPNSAFEDRSQLNVYAGLFSSNRSGTSGLGKFHQFNPYVGVTKLIDDWRISLRFDYVQLYSDHPPENAWFGSDQYSSGQNFHSGIEDSGAGISISRQLDNFNVYADLRYQLIDQPVNSTITGQLGGTWYGDGITSTATLYRLRKTDSLLSTAGARDQALEDWGGVIATGARAMWVKSLNPDLSVALNGDYASLAGERTEDNDYLSVGVSLNFDVKDYVGQFIKQELDYVRVGPRLNYFTYDKNQSLFTVSHGGYFSPQQYWNLAAFAQLLTAEGKNWQVKFDADIGYSSVDEDGVKRLHYDSLSTEFVPSSSTKGISANVLLEGQWKFAEHWVISGFYKQANAVRYRSSQFGLQITWKPGRVDGLTSDGLINNNPWHTGFALW